jgi:hypothetical protein
MVVRSGGLAGAGFNWWNVLYFGIIMVITLVIVYAILYVSVVLLLTK